MNRIWGHDYSKGDAGERVADRFAELAVSADEREFCAQPRLGFGKNSAGLSQPGAAAFVGAVATDVFVEPGDALQHLAGDRRASAIRRRAPGRPSRLHPTLCTVLHFHLMVSLPLAVGIIL